MSENVSNSLTSRVQVGRFSSLTNQDVTPQTYLQKNFVMDRVRIRENVLIHLDSLQKRERSAMTRSVSTLAIREVSIMF